MGDGSEDFGGTAEGLESVAHALEVLGSIKTKYGISGVSSGCNRDRPEIPHLWHYIGSEGYFAETSLSLEQVARLLGIKGRLPNAVSGNTGISMQTIPQAVRQYLDTGFPDVNAEIVRAEDCINTYIFSKSPQVIVAYVRALYH